MDDNLFKLIEIFVQTSSIGGVFVFLAWLFKPIAIKSMDNTARQRELEAKREEGELEQARKLETTLNAMNGELALLRQTNTLLGDRIVDLPTKKDMQQVGATMRDWATKHDGELKDVHSAVNSISPSINEQLSALKTEIEKLIEEMLASISDQLQSGANNTDRACKMLEEVKNDLRGLSEMVKSIVSSDKPEEADHGK